uniref:DUF6604 domain-containing protein n=1 Tax=Bionectria ochroleuca TaxID=29856 RepID=A0A0B7KE08_BIOOC
MTDYLVAVYDVFREIISVRSYTQDLWRKVAYDDLNSAVAAAVSNIAITAVRKMATQILLDFPGNDSFDAILQTITRGSPEKLKKNFSVSLLAAKDDNTNVRKVRENYVHIEEQFLMYVYKDFCDFIADFRSNCTGKPTKCLQTELANRDPKFKLEKATPEERIKWRRAYTINWLYDLVNLFSSIVVQRITLKGEKHDLATVDWSTSGPWHHHRRLFGLNGFAGFVTSLAFQNPSADLKSKIQPHHVFQLQCIVDSMTVSRGWRGELILRQLLDRDAASRGNPNLHEAALTEAIRVNFIDFLGETKYMYGLNKIPSSRFTSTNANGLYEHSPFLCSAGLLEGLELAYLIGIYIWDTAPELTMAIHLHNMLEKKGFLKKPIGLWSSIAGVFVSSLFANTKTPPTSLAQAFLDHAQRRDIRARARNKSAADLVGALNPKANMFFKNKSHTQILREAGWDPERIPDSDFLIPSILAAQRLSQVKRQRDPVTEKMKLEESELVRRAKKSGMSEDEIIALGSSVDALASINARDALKVQQMER